MSNEDYDKKINELGLRKVTAYLHEALHEDKTLDDIALEKSECNGASKGKTGAARKRISRDRQKELGRVQLNIVVPDLAEIRELMPLFVKRLVELNSWSAAIRTDTIVLSILATLEHANIRLRRLDDLEERHRRTFYFIQFHNEVTQARGIRRILLYYAGVVDSITIKNKYQRAFKAKKELHTGHIPSGSARADAS
jgi:hypothetical protein